MVTRSILASRRSSNRAWLLYFMVFLTGSMMLVACGKADLTPPPTVKTAMPTPAGLSIHAPTFTEKVNLDAFTPPGEGRDLTIMNCDNCHSWVCTVRGQKTLDHWTMVEDVHRWNWRVKLPEDDWNALFVYLEDNFNDQQPEPVIPAAYKQAGCAFDPYR